MTQRSDTATLDLRRAAVPSAGLQSPHALEQLNDGEVLKLITTDPGPLADISVLARQKGEPLVASEESGDTKCFGSEGAVMGVGQNP